MSRLIRQIELLMFGLLSTRGMTKQSTATLGIIALSDNYSAWSVILRSRLFVDNAKNCDFMRAMAVYCYGLYLCRLYLIKAFIAPIESNNNASVTRVDL